MSLLSKKHDKRFWPQFEWRDIGVLTAALATYATLVSLTLTKFSLWFDEAFGSYLVRFDISQIAYYTSHDVHPPLYYWLLKIWTMVFGNTEFGLRSMSVFFGAVTIAVLFAMLLRFFGRRVAYTSLVLVVLSPMLLRYGQEARMYTLLTTIIVAATYLMLYAEQTKKRWAWILYGVFVGLGMLTQYFAALVWVAHWVWRFAKVRRPHDAWKKTWRAFFTKNWLQAHGVALLVFAPWLPYFLRQLIDVQGNGFWIGPVTVHTIPNFFSNAFLFTQASATTGWFALAIVLIIAAYGYLALRVRTSVISKDIASVWLFVALVIVPIIALFILSLPPLRPVFVDRYLIGAVLFLPVVMALLLVASRSSVSSWLYRATASLTVIVLIVGVYNQAVVGNYNKSSGNVQMARQIVEATRGVDATVPIVTVSPWLFYEVVPYSKDTSKVYFTDETIQYKFGSLRMLKEDDTFKIKKIDDFATQHKRFWLLGDANGVKSLRDTWQQEQSVSVTSYIDNKTVLSATLFSVE